MAEKIELVDIVRSKDFLREVHRAANQSYEHNKESGYLVYTDEHFSRPYVNRAVLGEEKSMETDLSEATFMPKTGFHIPIGGYRLVQVHFHPPRSHVRPSPNDISEHLASRRINLDLREYSDAFQKEIYKDKEEIALQGYEYYFPNPISMIGVVKDKPENLELLVYQGITKEPVTFEKFCEFVADYCQELYGTKYDPCTLADDYLLFGFPTRFRSTKRVVEFLNASTYFRAADIKIRNGKLFDKDLEKLNEFQLIQARFFSDKLGYSEEDDVNE